jgi:glycosyltransferase involved in cell wall biosynthesis
MNETKHWVLFYRAASNRHFWLIWDLVLDDIDPRIVDGVFVDKDRMYLPFRKPIPGNIFYPIDGATQEFDICIGASHLHRKKGQERSINALIHAQKILNRKLKCIMPGRPFKPSYLAMLLDTAEKGDLDVYAPGMVSKELLAGFYNASKLYVHLATCGQNDRGVLEAMACGTPAMIGYPKYHPPWMYGDKRLTFVADNADDPDKTAENIVEAYQIVVSLGKAFRDRVRIWYLEQNGMREQSLPMMVKLFEFFKTCPQADRPKLHEYYNARIA